MKYAETVKDIPNAFLLGPLTDKDLDEYYIDTMEVRTSDAYSSPIQDIIDACERPGEHHSFLLLGHRGCGKSTELNKLSEKLKAQAYPVYTISCGVELDLLNITHTDLMILAGEALLHLAEELGIKLGDLKRKILDFWKIEIERIIENENAEGIGVEAGADASIGFPIFKLFASLKSSLKFNTTQRETYREQVKQRSSEWIELLRKAIDLITREHKQPVLIFEDLDKLEPSAAWRVFDSYSATLSSLSCPVIYTFPIALSYDSKFSALLSFFDPVTLPMIKINYPDGQPCEEGYRDIEAIVKKRMDTDLFSGDTLDYLIKKTGGALRDLFSAISKASRRAVRRNNPAIEREDAEIGLNEIKTSLTRRIDSSHYAFLVDIYKGNHELIEDKEKLLEMLQAGTVLEYNGKRWHNVHPLVADFLVEQNLTV